MLRFQALIAGAAAVPDPDADQKTLLVTNMLQGQLSQTKLDSGFQTVSETARSETAVTLTDTSATANGTAKKKKKSNQDFFTLMVASLFLEIF